MTIVFHESVSNKHKIAAYLDSITKDTPSIDKRRQGRYCINMETDRTRDEVEEHLRELMAKKKILRPSIRPKPDVSRIDGAGFFINFTFSHDAFTHQEAEKYFAAVREQFRCPETDEVEVLKRSYELQDYARMPLHVRAKRITEDNNDLRSIERYCVVGQGSVEQKFERLHSMLDDLMNYADEVCFEKAVQLRNMDVVKNQIMVFETLQPYVEDYHLT